MELSKLLTDLEDPSETVRKRAVLQLGQNVDLRAVTALMRVAKSDENLEVRFYAKKVLFLYRERLQEEKARRTTSLVTASLEDALGPATGEAPGGLPADAEELELLHRQLQDDSPKARIQAIMALVQIRDPGILTELRRLDKREESDKVRAALALAFGLLGGVEDIPMVCSYLSEEDPRIRGNAIDALKMLGGVDATPDIARLLKDADKQVKAAALAALLGFPRKKLIEHFSKMMASTHVDERDTAAYALLKLALPETIPLIVSALSDKEIAIRLKARNTLVAWAKNGSEEAAAALSRYAGVRSSPDAFMTVSVIERRIQTEQLEDTRPRERIKAIRLIVEAGARDRVPGLLQALLREKDSYVRATLVMALGRLKAKESVEALKSYVVDDDPRIRANAVEALGAIGGGDVFPLIIPCLEDDNNRVCANAIVALGECPYAQLEKPLLEMLHSKSVLMRRSAIYAIVELRRPNLVSLIAELLDDHEQIVKDKARDALLMLASEGIAEARLALEECKTQVG